MAPSGGALGVDISAPAIELARELARLERVPNVTSERSDAQVYPFPLGSSILPSAGEELSLGRAARRHEGVENLARAQMRACL
jgi:hypothetical protein